ncbi:MAG TPA: ankyrin repeat domain-containing protein [Noviherbaspirillum sp.]|jgi:ankyrin repeat protein|uniref:ankyrin repeat domain-containing protein n=1 Tax=Noviherbaspirillum sp. TaxID=1926288 RepID=UPI002DDD1003|nr:ankyrin repeat domain-containing protein [Noviherbaspirillum sp.]HEV2611530.1 ankyrin repeat domain-containing protein [Noviherbaspirillum sp.]
MEYWEEFIGRQTDAEVLQYVHNHPELINARDESTDHYLLERAAFTLRLDLVEALLGLGANPNQLDPAGQLPLHSAIEAYWDNPRKSLALTKLLIDHGADIENRGYPDFTALHRASLRNAFDIVILLVTMGADINARSEDRGDGGRTPLDVAEMHKLSGIAQYLREHGAVNA